MFPISVHFQQTNASKNDLLTVKLLLKTYISYAQQFLISETQRLQKTVSLHHAKAV